VGDLLLETASILLRYPLHCVVLPALAVGVIPWLASAVALEFQPWWWWWEDSGISWWWSLWLGPENLLVVPAIGALWIVAARAVMRSKGPRPPQLGPLLRAIGLGTGLTLAASLTAALAAPAGLLVLLLPMTAIPACACESRSLRDTLRSGFAQGRRHGGRFFAAWLVLMMALLLSSMLVGIILLWGLSSRMPSDPEIHLFMQTGFIAVLRALWTGSWIGIIFALSIAAYARLRSVQVDTDEPRWVEVFR
jgi:hypothetical protein